MYKHQESWTQSRSDIKTGIEGEKLFFKRAIRDLISFQVRNASFK
ncbi:hypothetical protein NIES2111_25910 [Nostoc sp. NIES-2111]|nr:hypothetical protein NIES2111_25910 [Nostoc sp. NIES-2111]